jgi:hypothetical protein
MYNELLLKAGYVKYYYPVMKTALVVKNPDRFHFRSEVIDCSIKYWTELESTE